MENFSILKILGACGIIITFVFGVWFVDDRYISAEEMSQEKRKIYLKMNTSDYRAATKQFYEYQKLTEQNPDDINLKNSFEEIKTERSKLKDKVDLLLENGK